MTRVLLGILIGIIGLGAARFAFTPWPEPVHYHANWAVFVDGDTLDLSADRYMEDVVACGATGAITPEQRVHMHEGNDDVVHVHHDGVTWGHFLANLGWAIGDGWVLTDDGRRFASDGERRLAFVVNGFVVPSVHDRLIASGDRLLISWGTRTPDQALADLFPSVAQSAPEYNATQDPAGCAGSHEALTPGARLRKAFWN